MWKHKSNLNWIVTLKDPIGTIYIALKSFKATSQCTHAGS